jgi:hypothetical protein
VSFLKYFDEVFRGACSAGRDDRNANLIRNRPREFAVKSVARAVAIHRCQQNLAGTALLSFFGPHGGIASGRNSSTLGECLVTGGASALGIDRNDHGLRTKAVVNTCDEVRISKSRGVYADFVGSSVENSRGIIQ